MLVLFDIDGTLLHTQRAGQLSMHSAARELFGDHVTFDGVLVAGRIDPHIWADLARVNGIEDPAAHHERFRSLYARHLERRLADDNTVLVLPGVAALVDRLRADAAITLGLLTGNYPETGRLKLEAAGMDLDDFVVTAWGSDGRSRRDLPAVAMARHAEGGGAPLAPDRVVIIGDTPHDVDCALAHGCRCLAVATGTYPAAELEAAGADLVVDDLTGTQVLHEWITRPSAEAGGGPAA